jgi:hypothetical protein
VVSKQWKVKQLAMVNQHFEWNKAKKAVYFDLEVYFASSVLFTAFLILSIHILITTAS